MTGMLASIQSRQELELIQHLDIAIIDCKDPSTGALGALPREEVKSIVDACDTNQCLSATIGDLPMQAGLLSEAVIAMSATGVDYVKIGLTPDTHLHSCIDALSSLTSQINLIAVCFADFPLDLSLTKRLKLAGFKGVMLDTINKNQGGLTAMLSHSRLNQFMNEARHLQLLTGLAGSLTTDDISPLLSLSPDYLGFRSALCERHLRARQLSPKLTQHIIQMMQQQLSFSDCSTHKAH